jgi:hypothetical protein
MDEIKKFFFSNKIIKANDLLDAYSSIQQVERVG